MDLAESKKVLLLPLSACGVTVAAGGSFLEQSIGVPSHFGRSPTSCRGGGRGPFKHQQSVWGAGCLTSFPCPVLLLWTFEYSIWVSDILIQLLVNDLTTCIFY